MRSIFRFLLPCIVMTALVPLQSGAQTLFLPGSPEVEKLASLYREAGRSFPTTSFPLSKAELARFADELRAGGTRVPGASLDDYLADTLRLDQAHDHISAFGAASLAYSYRSQNHSMDPGLPTELQAMGFHRLFFDQPPLGTVQLDYSRDAGLEIGITAVMQREYFLDPFRSTNLWEDGGSGNPVALENQDIMRGFLWYDFHPLQVELGRDKVHVGPGRHSLYPSMDLPFLDMLRFRLPLDRLTGDLIISTLENRQRGYDLSAPDPPFGQTVILMSMHRWEYGFDTVRVGIGALAVYARAGNAYNLGDIFPVFSWHNADIGSNHISIIADASWVPVSGLSLQAQFGLQALSLSGVGINNQAIPTVPAAIVSAETFLPLDGGLGLELYLEGGYTHYLWGNFGISSSGSDSLARAIDRYYLDGGNVILPLTSPYGPGATWVELAASLQGIQWLDASVNTRFFSRMTDPSTGAPVNLVQTAYAGSTAIETAPHIDTWSVGCKVSALPYGFLRISVEPALYIQVDNRAGSTTPWFELNISAGVSGKADTAIGPRS